MIKLLNKLKVFFTESTKTNCNGDCNQGRNCDCKPVNFSEAIIEVHQLSSKVKDADLSMELKKVADRLAVLGNRYHDRYYADVEPPKDTIVENSVYNYDGLQGRNH